MCADTARTGARILVLDDDAAILDVLRIRLEVAGYTVTATGKEAEAIQLARDACFDLALIDLQLEQSDGIAVMQELRRICPDLPVIIMTAHGSVETAVLAMQKGAFNYVTKPFDSQDLLLQLDRALDQFRLSCEVKRLREFSEKHYSIPGIIAHSTAMLNVIEQVRRVAPIDSTVYIHGESGTGKELIAKAIHFESPRRDEPFIAINCAAIPENLLESELFGYEKGAFTGAVRKTKGIFERGQKGSVFLDEIGDMPLTLQAKLLRVLQERQFYPLGSETSVDVDVRVIVATNKDLQEAVESGRFREDLFYRIHVVPIHLPPLRERKEDIPSLAFHFLAETSERMHKKIARLSPAAFQKLLDHDWPGNIRELANTIEYAVAMCDDETITEDLVLHTRQIPETPILPLKDAREKFDRDYLAKLLHATSGNVSEAARLADRYRADLYLLLKKYHIQPDLFKK